MSAPLQEFAGMVDKRFGNPANLQPKTLQRFLNGSKDPFGRKTVDEYANAIWERLFGKSAQLTDDQKTAKAEILKFLSEHSKVGVRQLSKIDAFTKAVVGLAEAQGAISTKGQPVDKSPGLDARLIRSFAPYLVKVARKCSALATRGIPMGADLKDVSLPLAEVYVELETNTPKGKDSKAGEGHVGGGHLSALEALFDPKINRVVLVGEPGSGKSTFVQFVTLWLAAPLSGLTGENSPVQNSTPPELLSDRKLIPLRIVLREFAVGLTPDQPGSSADVEAYLNQVLSRGSHRDAQQDLPRLLKGGCALVLFDGLDEVPQSVLSRVREAIQAFAEGDYQACRIAVTCRTHSYTQYERSGHALRGFPKAHAISPLDSSLQGRFVHAWYRALELAREEFEGEGSACAEDLLEAIRNDPSERLKEMSGNPFFLTAMAGIHRPDQKLPNTGAALMNKLVDCVLEESRRAEADKNDGIKAADPDLAVLLKDTFKGKEALRLTLEEIAFEARAKRSRRLGTSNRKVAADSDRIVDLDLLENRLRKSLPLVPVADLINALRHRAGILQSEDGKEFGFAYRFEEFLAGCHLAKRKTGDNVQRDFHLRARQLLAEQQDYARQVVLWAGGFNAHVAEGDQHDVTLLVALLMQEPDSTGMGRLWNLELAADIAKDAGIENWPPILDPVAPKTVADLRTLLEHVRDNSQKFDIGTRATAATAIGRLGDYRPGVGVLPKSTTSEKDKYPDFAWCGPDVTNPTEPFPAGPFLMGGDPETYQSSANPFECRRIQVPFFITRYPVTVAQYRLFVQAKGYERDEFWTEAGRRWRDGKGVESVYEQLREGYLKQSFPLRGPVDFASVFQTPNHPRVGVSWFEAHAFTQWLSATWNSRKLGLPDLGWRIRLPTDAEWERAARWPNQPGERYFPWGNASDKKAMSERCNCATTGLNRTSAVGLFSPCGDTQSAIADMAGNVWEWCQSEFVTIDKATLHTDFNQSTKLDISEGTNRRVVRGGSWINTSSELLRASYRNFNHPGHRNDLCGFRLVGVRESV